MEIRPITSSDDRLLISNIYEESWKFAYKNIIPQSYLDSIPAGRWASGINKEGMHNFVVVQNGQYIGTSCICRSRFPELPDFGEIVSIYLLPEYIGKGYGKRLLDAVVSQLKEIGFNDIFLWVLEENSHARRFYEKAGFSESGRHMDINIGGKELREIQYIRHI
ncbi:MAG: GNAT family N-acetyltransferase [Oscillospiraceae bacterium]|nr:GNAT family N-acetyltransferase [Oscillospiraceae bacterium]